MITKLNIFILLISLFIFSSCGKEPLKKLDRYQILSNMTVNTHVDFCTIEANKIKSNLKYIFILDKSGSNQDLSFALGTDPNGERRYAPLLLYLDEAPEDETVFYSLINLSTNASLVSGFTNDKNSFEEAVLTESNPNETIPPTPSDGGWTNFSAALNLARDIISDDIQLAKDADEIVSSYYVVIFISDGAPWVGTEDLQSKADILDQVDSLIAFEEENREYVDSVQVHTGYYYNLGGFDPNAQVYMNDMAENGNGSFFEFGAGQIIDFSRFSVPERNVKHLLKDIIITNINTKWNNDSLQIDSDGDGLVDIIENDYHSDIHNPDSDGNGISDGVEYYTTGKPCKTLVCTIQGQDPCEEYKCDYTRAEPYEACNSWLATGNEKCEAEREENRLLCLESCSQTQNECNTLCQQEECPTLPTEINGVPIKRILDLDGDYLNDCEERVVLKSKHDSFDSNDDWIPDHLGFNSYLGFVEGSEGEYLLDPDWDGVSNYDEVKNSTPIKYDNSRIYGIKPYQYNLKVVKDDNIQTCFELDVVGIPIGSREDTLRVYIMESTSIIKNKKFMRTAEKQVIDENEVVKFINDDF
ncbi:VWA domain-containing protein [bacterium]|nr:VWA domain-containing protein [bacterium]